MRRLLLTLLVAFSTVLSAQCFLEVDVISAECAPAAGGVVITFTVTGPENGLWFSPTLNMEGSYGADQVYVSQPVDVNAGEIIRFVDQFDQQCAIGVPLDSVDCDNPCFNFGLEVEAEIVDCGPDAEVRWFVYVNANVFPVVLTASNEEGEVLFVGEQVTSGLTVIPTVGETEVTFSAATTLANCFADTTVTAPGALDCATVLGRSWRDDNRNGLQDDEEIETVPAVVYLNRLSANGAVWVLDTTTTDVNGEYSFDAVPPFQTYSVTVEPTTDENIVLTTPDQGDNGRDSDFYTTLGNRTQPFQLEPGDMLALDAGWVTQDCSQPIAELIISDVAGPCESPAQLIVVDAVSYPVNMLIFNADSTNIFEAFGFDDDGEINLDFLAPGEYFASLTDAQGCTQRIDISVAPTGFAASVRQSGSLCTDGAVTLTAIVGNDVGPVSYAWSTGETTSSITVNVPNITYLVEITNEDGCTVSVTTTVQSSSFDTVQVPEIVILPCEGGPAVVEIENPAPGAQYQWFGPQNFSATGTTVELPFPGFYEVFYDSDTGCSGFGFLEVRDLGLSDVRIQPFNQMDSLCGVGTCFGLLGLPFNTGAGPNDLITVSWTSTDPVVQEWLDGLDIPPVILCNAPEGIYTTTLVTQCDSVTLTYVNETLDCSEISGTLYLDGDGDCNLDDEDTPAPNFLVRLTNDATGAEYYAWTATDGSWSIELPDGSYTISAVIEDGQPLENCPPTSVTLAGQAVTGVNLFMSVLFDCPLLTTDITIPWLRRCFTGCAYVNYENVGTATGEDAVITVELDPFFTDVIPSIDPISVEGTVYTFNLGDLPPFSNGRIGFIFTISCDAELGQTHCIDARITPDDPCHNSDEWSGALVDITGVECTGDSLVFTVTNIGDNPMTVPLTYVIVEDGIMLSEDPFVNGLLAPEEDYLVSVVANGSTYSLMTNQEPNAPGNDEPTIVFEGCTGEGEDFSTGFSNLLPLISGNPSRSFVCRENVGAYDPNDKTGYPLGWDDGNVEEGTRIDYEIRFQNTGTDTAFTVVIRDTIAPELDLATFKMEAASHDYTLTIDTHRVVTWTFADIMLPDSNVNLLLSQGAVSFSIDHDESLVPGDVFRNEAAIYFDFNEPIITNRTRHVIAKDGLPVSLSPTPEYHVPLPAYPNPVTDRLNLSVPLDATTPTDLVVITDALGRPLRSIPFSRSGNGIDVSTLPAGYYVLLLQNRNGTAYARTGFVVSGR